MPGGGGMGVPESAMQAPFDCADAALPWGSDMTAIQREHRAFLPVHMQPSCQGYLGDRCRFSCEPGYRPYGNRTCTSWLGEIPPAKYVEVRAFRGGSCVAKSPSKPARAHPDLPADVDFVRTQVDMVSTPGVSGVCSHGADPGRWQQTQPCDTYGYDTYRLSLSFASSDVFNVYTIFGAPPVLRGIDAGVPAKAMFFPAAYHSPAPFGTNIGGTDPQLWMSEPNAQYDSWLTIGIVDGQNAGSLSTIGIDFDDWTPTQPLSVRNGAVFCMDPTTGSTNDPTVIAQISVATGSTWRATVNARGKRSGYAGGGGDDWEAVGLTFRGGGGH